MIELGLLNFEGGIWRGHPQPDFAREGFQAFGASPVLTSSFFFANETEVLEYHRKPMESHRYGRDSSPTAEFVEEWLSNLYGLRALVFPSGMAAIASSLQLQQSNSKHIFITREAYRKTVNLAAREATSISRFIGTSELREQLSQCKCEYKILFVESPGNPHLRIEDLTALSEVASDFDALRVWDASLAGLDNGVSGYSSYDIVIHSATKYISGHDDLLAGVAFCSKKVVERMFAIRSESSSVLDPHSSFLLARSLNTYDVRIARQLENTAVALNVLDVKLHEGKIHRIWYPGAFENADQASLVQGELVHGGCVISFTVAPEYLGNFKQAWDLTFLRLAPSFGSTRSLFEMPASMSHGGKSQQELSDLGVEENLVRLSIGIEPIASIARDLNSLFQ